MKILDITTFQYNEYIRIKQMASTIHPKLLEILTYEDLFDDSLLDVSIYENYNNTIQPAINQYNAAIRDMCNTFYFELVNDMSLILESTGYSLDTGDKCSSFKTNIPYDFMPCVELQPFRDGLEEIKSGLRIIPFWTREPYTLYKNCESVSIRNTNSYYGNENRTNYGIDYILSNRDRFMKSSGETNLQKFENAVRFKDTFDYPIYIEPVTPYKDSQIPSEYERSIQRHMILRQMLEHEIEELKHNKKFISKIDKDGNVTIFPIL